MKPKGKGILAPVQIIDIFSFQLFCGVMSVESRPDQTVGDEVFLRSATKITSYLSASRLSSANWGS